MANSWTRLVRSGLVAGGIVLAAGGCARATTLTDTSFANLGAVETYDPDGATVTVSPNVAPPAGGVGTAIDFSYSNPGLSATAPTAAILDNALVYDPSVNGAFNSVTISGNRLVQAMGSSSPTGNFMALIAQGGNFYVASIPGLAANASQWVTYAATLSALSFSQYNFATGTVTPNSNPNFAAGVLKFGVLATLDPAKSGDVLFDNLTVTTNVAPVPEPGTAGMVGAGLGLMALLAAFRILRPQG